MSIWASICGEEPAYYDGGYGDPDRDPEGWMDVAVSCLGDRYRIIVKSQEGEGQIVLDDAGLAELHRRIVIARGNNDRS